MTIDLLNGVLVLQHPPLDGLLLLLHLLDLMLDQLLLILLLVFLEQLQLVLYPEGLVLGFEAVFDVLDLLEELGDDGVLLLEHALLEGWLALSRRVGLAV